MTICPLSSPKERGFCHLGGSHGLSYMPCILDRKIFTCWSDYLFRKICHTKHGFSFRLQQLTYSRATELFEKQLKVIGLNPKQYGLHSLRSGGASSAAAAAIPDRLLMRHGGWRSQTAKNMYINEIEQALLRVSRALCLQGGTVTSLVLRYISCFLSSSFEILH